MAGMMFFVLYNYTILRNTKDALVVTAAGPEVIPFLKGIVILPIALLFVTGYTKITNVLRQEYVFYLGILMFLAFFSFFALYLYPNREFLQPDPQAIAAMKAAYPNFQHLISVYETWVFSVFYIFSELWGTIILGLLFWQFANEITRINEAKRFYAMFAFLGHFALLAAGFSAKHFCTIQRQLEANGADGCGELINLIVIFVVLSGLVIVAIFRWINKKVLINPQYYDAAASNARRREKKPKMSVLESFKHVLSSKYIGLIAVLVVGYGASNNILGVIWKKQIKLQYPNPTDYSDFMGTFSIWTGIATITLIYCFKGIVPKFGWFWGAIVTPMVLLIMGALFLTFVFFNEGLTPIMAVYGITPLFMALWVGTSQQILSKSSKYSMFDPTKEMSYIPLDPDLKVRGKAAVDVIAHSFSKAFGGYITGGLLLITAASDLMTIAPYLAAIVLCLVITWIIAVKVLYGMYKALVNQRSEI